MDNFNWISINNCLPADGELVLTWFGGYAVAKFEKGITQEQRAAMKSGETEDPIEEVYSQNTGYIYVPRSDIYRESDVCFNNQVPFCWTLLNGSFLRGQDVSHWAPLPEAPKSKPPAKPEA